MPAQTTEAPSNAYGAALLDTRQVAAHFRVGRRMARRILAADPFFPFTIRRGKRVLIRAADFDAALAKLREGR